MNAPSTPHSPPSSHSGGVTHAPPAPASAGSEARATNPPNSRAWAIGGILIVFVLIVGVLIVTKFQHGNTNPLPPQETAVPVKLLIDQSCKYCPKTNTILQKLDESHITYALETYDIQSEEGKALAQEYDVSYVPAALVNIKGLDQNSTVQRALQGQYIKDALPIKKGWIVVEEKSLDGQPKLLTFVNPPEACSIKPNTISLMAQLDFGDCKPCIAAYELIQKIKQNHPELDVTYKPIVYNRTTPLALAKAIITAKGAVCADTLGFLNDYTSCNFFNATFQGSQDINYMKACMHDAGASVHTVRDEFVPCVEDANGTTENDLVNRVLTMRKWNPLGYTPSFVLDCKYAFVGQNSIAPYMCALHPELGCPAPTPTDTNTSGDTNGTTFTGTPDANGNVYINIEGPHTSGDVNTPDANGV